MKSKYGDGSLRGQSEDLRYEEIPFKDFEGEGWTMQESLIV
ncbi:hypothetical protein [Ornithinibacillus californiensis]|nr:hypothetical protein [Ornithinibacillus californiensis]